MGKVPSKVTVEYEDGNQVLVDVAAADGAVVSVFWGEPQTLNQSPKRGERPPDWMSSLGQEGAVCWVDSNGVLHCPHPT